MFKTYFKVDKEVFHLKVLKDDTAYYLCAWYVQNIASLKSISSRSFIEQLSERCRDIIIFQIWPVSKGIGIEIGSDFVFSGLEISIVSRSGKIPLKLIPLKLIPLKLSKPGYKVYRAYIEGEDFQKLKEPPDNTNIIICRMKYVPKYPTVPESPPTVNSRYINSLKADLEQYSGTSSNEIVSLRVGEETERVNKAILCIRSPVFAKMFENDMKELKDNTVTITDIKMPVLRVLVSFLYFGILPKCDFDFTCQLYYAVDKYDIKDLRMHCISLLISKASLENLPLLLKSSLSHSDELLKSLAMTLISANIEEIILTPDWKNFMHEEPEIAMKAATFFDLNWRW